MSGSRRALRRAARAAASVLAVLLGCRGEPAPPPEAAALAARMLAGTYEAPGYAYPLPYRLFVPAGYDATRAAWPVVLYLHGSSGRGRDGVRHLSAEVASWVSPAVQAVEPSFVLAPQCPPGDEWVNRHDAPPFSNYDQALVRESDAARMTLSLLDELAARYRIDRDRVYVTGFSMGGSGTWDVVTRHPGIFAAAVPVTGVNDPSRAPAIASLAVWAFHGRLDDVSPVENTREMVDALRRLGSPVRYTELADVGHGSSGPAYATPDLYQWVFRQRRAMQAAR